MKKELEVVSLTDTQIKTIVPLKVFHQIQYLCKNISKVEWSGVLFYKVEGSIKDPANMVVTLEDILPLHKGTAGYTEYSFDSKVADHIMEHEFYPDKYSIAHIHSHNSMGVFFSGTDWSELKDNAPNHNIYLSFIVNNYMEFCAKICFVTTSKSEAEVMYSARDEKGDTYNYTTEKLKVANEKLIVYDCAIESPANTIETTDVFRQNVEAIIKKAEQTQRVFSSPYGQKGLHMQNIKGYEDDWGKTDWRSFDAFNDEIKDYSKTVVNREIKPENYFTTMFTNANHMAIVMESFAIKMFSFKSKSKANTLEELIEIYYTSKVTVNSLVQKLMNSYKETFESYFATILNEISTYDLEGIKDSFVDYCYEAGFVFKNVECKHYLEKVTEEFENKMNNTKSTL